MYFNLFVLLSILSMLQYVFSIIAYDCSHDNINITSISTLHVEMCPKYDHNIKIEYENVYLMQRAEVIPLHVYQCKISITQFIKYCGWNGYDSVVSGGISTFVKDIDRDNCLKLHETGHIILDNGNVFQDIKSNATSSYVYRESFFLVLVNFFYFLTINYTEETAWRLYHLIKFGHLCVGQNIRVHSDYDFVKFFIKILSL